MRKAAIGFSIALNVIFVVATIALFAAFASGYIIKQFIEPAHARWVSQFEALPVNPGDSVFLGDSITEGGSWHELFPEASVRNRGIGGDVTLGVLQRIDQVRQGQPGQVFLMIGTNDLAFGVPEDEIVGNTRKIIDEIHAVSEHTEIYVQSVLPRAAEYREAVESLNKALQPAIDGAATWIDLYPIFLDDDGSIRDAYSNDELHLLGAGYVTWRDAIRPYVKRR